MSFQAEFREPDKNLSWLVRQFEEITFDGKREILDKFIPRADISLVFHFETPPCLLKPELGTLPFYFIAPVVPKANLIQLCHQNCSFIITCKPTVFSRFFGISLTPIQQIFIPLPRQLFHPLWEQLKETGDFNERIETFTRFVASFGLHPYEPDLIDRVYDDIVSNAVFTTLQEISSQYLMTERTLQRNFGTRLGISPKKLARIVRINYLWEKIKNNKTIDSHDLVFLGNYFDQNHFIKDFKAITGETPRSFFKRDLHNVNILSGKKDQNN